MENLDNEDFQAIIGYRIVGGYDDYGCSWCQTLVDKNYLVCGVDNWTYEAYKLHHKNILLLITKHFIKTRSQMVQFWSAGSWTDPSNMDSAMWTNYVTDRCIGVKWLPLCHQEWFAIFFKFNSPSSSLSKTRRLHKILYCCIIQYTIIIILILLFNLFEVDARMNVSVSLGHHICIVESSAAGSFKFLFAADIF